MVFPWSRSDRLVRTRRGWVALTHHAQIRYKPNELAAVIRYRVCLLVIFGKARFQSSRGPSWPEAA
jgi:hypothetical protein